MRHTTGLFTVAAATIALAACTASVSGPSPEIDFPSFNGARISVVAEGGFAPMHVVDSVEHDTRVYMHTSRPLCAPNCTFVRDSAAGVFPATTTDSIFSAVLPLKNTFKDDYGITTNGADMQTYTVTITSDGTIKRIHADDGTMPAALRQIVSGLRAAISATKK
jgi:hypothetical protein